MRSQTLLTGLTGTVAVLVLLYVGLTAMNLQPHLTFGEPAQRVASADAGPARPAASEAAPPVSAPAATAVSEAPQSSDAPPSASALQVAAPPVQDKTDKPAIVPPAAAVASAPAVSSPAMSPPPSSSDAAPKVAASPAPTTQSPAPAPAIAVPPAPATVTVPPPVEVPEPSASVAAREAPAMAPASPEATPPVASAQPPSASSPATPPLPTPPLPTVVPPPIARPDIETSPSVAGDVPASVEEAAKPAGVAPVDTDQSLSERMAPSTETPTLAISTPSAPSAASVPTPMARPEPPATGRNAEIAVAENAPLQDKDEHVDKAPPSDDKAPTVETAVLTPQPDKPSEAGGSLAPPAGDLKSVDLSRPFAERAGILTIGGRSLQIAGLLPTDPERSCTGPNGKEWPCGTLARTALRSFLLGRTISCEVPDPAWKGSVTADCRFAKVSVGDWLVRNGWAEVAAGSPYSAAAEEARKAGRGVYGNDPRKKHQSTLAPEPPKDDPLNPI